MAFDVTALPEYKEPADKILLEQIVFPIDYKHFGLQTGITDLAAKMVYMSVAPEKTSDVCGTGEGATTLTDKDLVVAQFSYKDKYCLAQLRAKGLQNIDVPSWLAEATMRYIKSDVEREMWVGDTSGTDYIDGWATQALAAVDTIAHPSNGTLLTSTNIDEVMAGFASTIAENEAVKAEGLITINMSAKNFNVWKAKLTVSERTVLRAEDFKPNEMWLPGYEGEIKLRGQVKMNSVNDNDMFATFDGNLIRGVDEVNNQSSSEVEAVNIEKQVYARTDFKLGTGIAFTNLVIYYNEIA